MTRTTTTRLRAAAPAKPIRETRSARSRRRHGDGADTIALGTMLTGGAGY
jgi:hypothetical protein